ncbi:MAG: PilZ domain-containing protein [Planctomycetota bacterium]
MSRSKANSMLEGTWRATLADLASQNKTVEIRPMTNRGEELPSFRARVLQADDKDSSLIIEKPANIEQAQVIAKGIAVQVYVITGTTRMKADSQVIDVGRFSLNKQTKVMAVRLEPVKNISSAQRRACFRLSTAGMGMIARFRHPDWSASKPDLKAKAIDISDRGLGLTVAMDLEAAKQMIDEVYGVLVPLPGQEESLELDARLVRVVESDLGMVTLGFQFEFCNLNEQRRVEQVIQQFSVAQQRKQIRRMRGAG